MIISSRTQEMWQTMAAFLRERAGVQPSADLRMMGWVSDDKLVIVVGLHGFLGKVAQIHVAFAENWHYAPKQLLREVFRYAFMEQQRDLLLGVVNSKNTRAMNMDAQLGFKEMARFPKLHDDEGDIVVLGLKKSDCRHLDEPEVEPMVTEAVGHA